MSKTYSVADILRSGSADYGLSLFSAGEIDAIEIFDRKGKPHIRCLATDKERPAKPEEIVRQLYLHRLIESYGYPKSRIFLEKPVYFGSSVRESGRYRDL